MSFGLSGEIAMAIKNLVFEGGGVRGVTYGGVIKALAEELDFTQIQRVGGSSAGAIAALFLALDYKPHEIQDTLLTLNFKEFLDDDFGFIRDTKRLLTEFGWYKGQKILDWLGEVIKKKTGNADTTFDELKHMSDRKNYPFRSLYIVGCNINTGNAEVFSHETKHKHLPIRLATRITASVPIFFQPVLLNDAYYVDGGVLRNYPITLFDDWKYNANIPKTYILPFNFETLGFRLDTREEIQRFLNPDIPNRFLKVNNFVQYAQSLITLISNTQNEEHLHSFDQNRTVYCDTLNVTSTNFRISVSKRIELINSGYLATKAYLKSPQYPLLLKENHASLADYSLFEQVLLCDPKRGQHWLNLKQMQSSHKIA